MFLSQGFRILAKLQLSKCFSIGNVWYSFPCIVPHLWECVWVSGHSSSILFFSCLMFGHKFKARLWRWKASWICVYSSLTMHHLAPNYNNWLFFLVCAILHDHELNLVTHLNPILELHTFFILKLNMLGFAFHYKIGSNKVFFHWFHLTKL